jgi:hypothetical protein
MNLIIFLHDFLFTVKFIFYYSVWSSSARVPQYDLQYKHCSLFFVYFCLRYIYIYIP